MKAHPGARALNLVRELLRALSAAQQTYRLYPAGHPNRVEAMRALTSEARSMIDVCPETPVLFVTRHGFYLGPALLSRESLTLYRLVEAFESSGVEAVEFLPGVSEPDLDGLVRILIGERGNEVELPSITINRVRPVLDAGAEGVKEMNELLRTYAVGLEVLRETAERVAAGEEADLEATRRVIEQLAAQVGRDPAQALLMTAVKSYDEYTYYHMLNVCILSLAMGHAIGLRQEQVVALGIGGLLHDVGKVKVPKEVLQQVGALSEEQWRLIQQHPIEGAGIILSQSDTLLDPTAAIILEHHAAYDLSGYPSLSGRPRPSLPARMVAVADCFDAVTSNRSYRKSEDRRQALSILQAGAGRAFDPLVVSVFTRLLGLFPVGSLVELGTGEIGVVVANHEQDLSHPVVRLVLDAAGNECDPREVDLAAPEHRASDLSVVRTMDPYDAGVDMLSLLASGRLEEPAPEHPSVEPGLVHEPSPGEKPPAGYVDTHANGQLEERPMETQAEAEAQAEAASTP